MDRPLVFHEPGRDAIGWPWSTQVSVFPERMPNGEPWPKVSVVTPSYNQAAFLEETVRSVIMQGYPNLEYIVIDGLSTDNSVDIIKKYEPWISSWVSEPDKGQSDAIMKGFERSSGDILAWINSDDVFEPWSICLAVLSLMMRDDIGLVCGDRVVIDQDSRLIRKTMMPWFFGWQLRFGRGINQETAFWKRNVYFDSGKLDSSLHYVMDYDFWWRVVRQTKVFRIPMVLGRYRAHETSKSIKASCLNSSSTISRHEARQVREKYLGYEPSRLHKKFLAKLSNFLMAMERLSGLRSVLRGRSRAILTSVSRQYEHFFLTHTW